MAIDHLTKVGDVVRLVRGTTYQGALVGKPGPALLGLGSIVPGGGFRNRDFKTYGGECPEKLMLRPNDLYVSLKGATKSGDMIGSIARVPPEVETGRLTQDTVKLVLNAESEPLRSYLYWLLRTPHYRGYCAGRATGSAVVALSRDDFLSYPLPPLSTEGEAIVAVLDHIDDKIELNRRMNETLEAMARALFRDWFVDFGPTRAKMAGATRYLSPDLWSLFPDSLDDADKPEGWEFSTIGSLTHRVTKGTTPTKQQVTAALDEAWINFLRVNNLSKDGKLLLGNTVKVAQSVHEGALRRSILQQDDLLYSIAGTIGRVAKTPKDVLPANVNQAIAIVRPNPELASPNYLLLWLSDEGFQNDLHSNIVQAVQANLSLGILSNARILVPPREIHTTLLRPINTLLERKAHNERESRTLAQTRDLLLPRLMSGELRVAGAEHAVEAVQ